MCDTVFAIGQRGGYHFESPSKWSKGRLPDKVQSLFTDNKIAAVHCLALGDNENFFIAYKSKDDGRNRCQCEGLPDALVSFLFEKGTDGYLVRSVEKLQVTLGPYSNSWWATDGTNWKWSGLPDGLNKAIEERRKPGGGWTATPRLVALGAADNYLMITESNGGAWNLSSYPHMQALIQMLSEDTSGGFGMLHSVFLNAYRLGCGILQSKNGTSMAFGLPPHAEEAFATIQEAIKEDTLAKLKREAEEIEAQQELEAQIARLKLKQAEAELAQQRFMTEMLTASAINQLAAQTAFNINLMNAMNF